MTTAYEDSAAPGEPSPPTRAKIIATVGPASETDETIRAMIEAGVGVFRFNFSHGDLETHARRLGVVRRVASDLGRTVGVLGDLQGPKIRVGRVRDARIELHAGQDVVLHRSVAESFIGDDGRAVVSSTYERLVDEVEPGQRVLINDGAIRMLAVAQGDDHVACRVVIGGVVTTGKGINLPDTRLSAPAITEKDRACAAWAVEHDLDFLALSFVSRAEDIFELRRLLADTRLATADAGSNIPIVAKIERPQAVEQIDSIATASDIVMIARGDLGVEMDIARVPVEQKRILAVCHARSRPAIVATQMLESMIESATPTRAEATDIAGAVFDGADALMLSGETAVGRDPVLAVATMSRIIGAAEEHLGVGPTRRRGDAAEAMARGAQAVARNAGAALVVCWSQSGLMSRHLGREAFEVPIVAYSSSERATRRTALLSGVTPVLAPRQGSREAWLHRVDSDLVGRGWARPGDLVVVVAGREPGRGIADEIALHRIGAQGGVNRGPA
jgi:pyruvate kinase